MLYKAKYKVKIIFYCFATFLPNSTITLHNNDDDDDDDDDDGYDTQTYVSLV